MGKIAVCPSTRTRGGGLFYMRLFCVLFSLFGFSIEALTPRPTLFPFKINPDRIREIFADPKATAQYKGQEGYLLFTEQTPNANRMCYIFNMASKALGKSRFRTLNWQKFYGGTEEFRSLRSRILDNEGNALKEYRGQEGQARFADAYYSGDMFLTFMNVSAVLGKQTFKRLEWREFSGGTEEFRSLRSRILDNEGNALKEYRGQEGQARFADTYYSGDMYKTFKNISAVLYNREFNKTGWRHFKGGTEEFHSFRDRILDNEGNVREEYRGQEGQALFADIHYNGAMHKAFTNVSAVLGGAGSMISFGLVEWKSFIGDSAQYRRLVRLFRETAPSPDRTSPEEGEVSFPPFYGAPGQEEIAERFFKGDKKTAYRNVSILRETLFGCREAFNALKWLNRP